MAVTIRTARLEDAERLQEIYAYYVTQTAVSFELEPPTVDAFRERMRRTLERFPYLVIEEDGRVLGYAYAGPFVERAAYDHSCEMTIYLDREARGKGIGRQLYTALQEELKARGKRNLYARISYPEMEDEYLTRASTLFHKSLGFAEAGHFHGCGCKFGRIYDMIIVEKLI